MINKYSIRKATVDDIPFLIEAIVNAENSNSDKLGLAFLFDLSERQLQSILVPMLEENISGCEFSLSSFLIADFEGVPVATISGWIEGYQTGPSSLITSELISYYLPKKNLKKIKNKLILIRELHIEREKNSFQLEYSYTKKEHRGKFLVYKLIKAHMEHLMESKIIVKKIQTQLYENNLVVRRLMEVIGFKVVRKKVCGNNELKMFLPDTTKLLMEKEN